MSFFNKMSKGLKDVGASVGKAGNQAKLQAEIAMVQREISQLKKAWRCGFR